MAITYPLTLPAQSCIRAVDFEMANASAKSVSPTAFTSKVYSYSGQMWLADVALKPMRRDQAAQWQAFLAKCRGQIGTFLLGDPFGAVPRGGATAGYLNGSVRDSTVSVGLSGSLLEGDYIQIGTGADATLHMVLEDRVGSGSLEIWPALRKSRSNAALTLSSPKGLFRLAARTQGWTVNELRHYGMTFAAEEVVLP